MDARAKRAISAEQAELLRQIPSVDELLLQPRLAALSKRVERSVVVEVARAVLADLRGRIAGELAASVVAALSVGDIEGTIAEWVERILARSLQPVINATGVILHTNLGRAPLTESVVEEFRRTATQYSNLEYDLEAGARGKRDVHTAELLTRLTGAEAAIVVNNCAAAVLVALAALARGGAVLVSRGGAKGGSGGGGGHVEGRQTARGPGGGDYRRQERASRARAATSAVSRAARGQTHDCRARSNSRGVSPRRLGGDSRAAHDSNDAAGTEAPRGKFPPRASAGTSS